MKQFLLISLLGLLFFAQASAQDHQVAKQLAASKLAYEPVNIDFLSTDDRPDLVEKYKDIITHPEYYKVNWDNYRTILEMKPELLAFNIPSPSGTMNIELFKVNLLSQNFQLRDNQGNELSPQDAVFYRGTLADNKNTIVVVSFYENDFDFVLFGAQSYRLDQVEQNVFSLYSEENRLEKTPIPKCQNDDHDMQVPKENVGTESRTINSGNCMELYVECDFHMYQQHGSNVTNTETFVYSLYAEVATVYQNENIPISIAEVKVWTVSDPYVSSSTTFDVLKDFADEIQDTKPNKLCMLLSTRSLGGGIAWLDVLCSTYNAAFHAGPYAVSASLHNNVTPYPAYSWNLNVVAHETGHNIGSPHTHKCVWGANNDTQIDDCGSEAGYPDSNASACWDTNNPILPVSGTVMSYCHLINTIGIDPVNGFGPEPSALILNKYTNASCNTGTTCLPLPVELVLFEAEKQGKGVDIYWQTESERNNEGFELFRSSDGEDWISLGWISPKGNGTTPESYLFYDAFPQVGVNYYQLKQKDFDGRFEYSDVRSVTFEGDAINPSFAPNPASQSITFSFVPKAGLDVTLFDLLGRLLLSQKIYSGEQLNISSMSKGAYWLQFKDTQGTSYQKLIIE